MRLLLSFLLFITSLISSATTPTILDLRARRAYDAAHWLSAQALYGMVTDSARNDAGANARLITAGIMRADTSGVDFAFDRALLAATPLVPMLDSLEHLLGEQGRRADYVAVIERFALARPYLHRPLMSRLLSFSTKRHDGTAMVRFAMSLLKANPNDLAVLNSLAWGYLYCGDNDSAEVTWRRVLEIDSQNVAALVALAHLIADTDSAEALDLLRRAYAITPTPALRSQISAMEQ